MATFVRDHLRKVLLPKNVDTEDPILIAAGEIPATSLPTADPRIAILRNAGCAQIANRRM
ncbi:hypothetical protein [Nonomuraea dietziae]|uniref:hypothetical protein n=1 Tax=Nonomuraea dietziae TaxID=65515 RepID=UPI003411B7C1